MIFKARPVVLPPVSVVDTRHRVAFAPQSVALPACPVVLKAAGAVLHWRSVVLKAAGAVSNPRPVVLKALSVGVPIHQVVLPASSVDLRAMGRVSEGTGRFFRGTKSLLPGDALVPQTPPSVLVAPAPKEKTASFTFKSLTSRIKQTPSPKKGDSVKLRCCDAVCIVRGLISVRRSTPERGWQGTFDGIKGWVWMDCGKAADAGRRERRGGKPEIEQMRHFPVFPKDPNSQLNCAVPVWQAYNQPCLLPQKPETTAPRG